MPIARRTITLLLTATIGWLALPSASTPAQDAAPPPAATKAGRPNFVVILCDDLGYGDLACYGHRSIRTPHLDRLAQEGIRFTQCYSAAPVCSPARAGLLTGRVPSRSGIYDWIPAGSVMHLRKEEVTMAARLKQAGYATCHVGKWHLNGTFNSPDQPQPGDHGFDYWMSTQNNAAPSHENPRNFVRNGQPLGPTKGFSCQIVADEAIAWLNERRDKTKPFFLFVCFHEPHEPIASPAELVANYPSAKKQGEAEYFANVENMDRAVGRLVAALDGAKLADQTLIFFTSDNGPETLNRYPGAARSHGSAAPLSGMKLHLREGGIRVPGILRWPGRIAPAQVKDAAVSALDLLPTLLELAGLAGSGDPRLDGTSLVPLLVGDPWERSKPLFWHYYRSLGPYKAALRQGDWKLMAHWDGPQLGAGGGLRYGDVEQIKAAHLTTYELFDLKSDPREERDVAKEHPEVVKELSRLLVERYGQIQREGPAWSVPKPPAPPK